MKPPDRDVPRDEAQTDRASRRDVQYLEFVAARSTQLSRSAYLLTGSLVDAEDLVQSALAKTYAAWWRVRRADDPVAYVNSVMIKTFISSRRRRSSTELPVESVPDKTHHDPDLSDRTILIDALRQLGPTDRAVVVLRYWEDRSVRETADALGLSEAAVKNRSIRSLRTLKSLLASPISTPGTPTSGEDHG